MRLRRFANLYRFKSYGSCNQGKKDFRSVERPFTRRHSFCKKCVLTTLSRKYVQKKCPKISQFRALKRVKIISRLKAEIQATQIKEKNHQHQQKSNVDQIDLEKYQ